MTNEELALRAQQGDEEAFLELWEQMQRYIYYVAYRWLDNYGQSKLGVDVEDLVQEGYFALRMAVKAYNPAKGFMFSAYLGVSLRRVFAEAAGFRKAKQALNYAISLDEPIDKNDSVTGLSMLGMIADDFDLEQATLETLYIQQLRQALDDAMGIVPEKTRLLLKMYFYSGVSPEKLAEMNGVSGVTIRSRMESGLDMIYCRRGHKLRKFLH